MRVWAWIRARRRRDEWQAQNETELWAILATAFETPQRARRDAVRRVGEQARRLAPGSDARWRDTTQVLTRPARPIDSPLITPNAAMRRRKPENET